MATSTALLLPLRLAPLLPPPRFSSTPRKLLLLAPLGRSGGTRRLRAAGDRAGPLSADQTAVYNGVYGPWSVDDADIREVPSDSIHLSQISLFPFLCIRAVSLDSTNQAQVLLYRSGLVTAAATFLVAASGAFLPGGNAAGDAIRQSADLLYAAGAAGLGLSLLLIHIYVTPIKRFLQALWAAGVVGSVGTYAVAARPLDEGLVQFVLDHPAALWFVGPTFAALTGLVFKEGKYTAALLSSWSITCQ